MRVNLTLEYGHTLTERSASDHVFELSTFVLAVDNRLLHQGLLLLEFDDLFLHMLILFLLLLNALR